MFWQSLNFKSFLLNTALRPQMPTRPPCACCKRPRGQELMHGMGQRVLRTQLFIQSPCLPAGAAPRCISAGRSPVFHPSPAVQKADQKSRAENHTSSPTASAATPQSDSKLQVKDSPKGTPAWPYRASPSSKPIVLITAKGTQHVGSRCSGHALTNGFGDPEGATTLLGPCLCWGNPRLPSHSVLPAPARLCSW